MAIRRLLALAAIGALAMGLAACQEASIPKDLKPLPAKLVATMDRLQMKKTSPVMIRLFKEESKMEVWKQRSDGQYALLKTYNICKWSGALGPKVKEGDRQAPEGFYVVTPAQMNPKSSYYLSFNIGYPNAYDRALGRTGSNLMVHGACSSSGCYSMTDADSGELFWLARDAFAGGQREFMIMAFPFRMTPENMARHRNDPNMPFWRMLKVGYDHFEVTRQVPKVDVCNKAYVFNADSDNRPFSAAAACPAYTVPPQIASAVAAKEAGDEQKFTLAVARLETKAEKDAAAKQKAEEKAAEDARKEAERASKPSLLNRIFGKTAAASPAKPADAAEGDTPPLPRVPPVAEAQADGDKPAALAVAPMPRLKPAKPGDEVASTEEAGKAEPVKAKPPAKKPVLKPTVDAVAAPAPLKAAAPPAPAAKPPVVAATKAPAPAVAAGPPAPQVVPAKAAPTATADIAPPAPGKTAALAGSPAVGTFVKKKFLWPDEDAPSAAAGGGEASMPTSAN